MPDVDTGSEHAVLAGLKAVFGSRLKSFVIYAPGRRPQPSLAIVHSLSFDDLTACAGRSRTWHQAGLATPILLIQGEFGQSLDAFPVEFGEIIATHQSLFGDDPFAGLRVDPADLRRACEAQVRSLLLHLREDYIEAGAASGPVRTLVTESAPQFRALLHLMARLDGRVTSDLNVPAWAAERVGVDPQTVRDLLHISENQDGHNVDTAALYRRYLAAAEILARRIDEWN